MYENADPYATCFRGVGTATGPATGDPQEFCYLKPDAANPDAAATSCYGYVPAYFNAAAAAPASVPVCDDGAACKWKDVAAPTTSCQTLTTNAFACDDKDNMDKCNIVYPSCIYGCDDPCEEEEGPKPEIINPQVSNPDRYPKCEDESTCTWEKNAV